MSQPELTLRNSAMALACTAALALALFCAPSVLAAQSRTETAVPVGGAEVRGMGPGGATLRCRDGFLPPAGAPDAACQERGGVMARYPLRRTPNRAAATRDSLARMSALRAAEAAQEVPRADTARPAWFEPYATRRQRADSLNRASQTRPAGATLLCNNGTWIVRDTASARCASHGGVRVSIPPTT